MRGIQMEAQAVLMELRARGVLVRRQDGQAVLAGKYTPADLDAVAEGDKVTSGDSTLGVGANRSAHRSYTGNACHPCHPVTLTGPSDEEMAILAGYQEHGA